MIDWTFFYVAFNSISVISHWQLTLFMSFLGFTSTRLGSEVSCPRTLPRKKPQRIQCGSNPGSLDYESNTLPLSHPGPFSKIARYNTKWAGDILLVELLKLVYSGIYWFLCTFLFGNNRYLVRMQANGLSWNFELYSRMSISGASEYSPWIALCHDHVIFFSRVTQRKKESHLWWSNPVWVFIWLSYNNW